MAFLVYAPWVFYGFDRAVPFEEMVKLQDDAGWSLQLYNRFGRVAHPGAVKVLHTPDRRIT